MPGGASWGHNTAGCLEPTLEAASKLSGSKSLSSDWDAQGQGFASWRRVRQEPGRALGRSDFRFARALKCESGTLVRSPMGWEKGAGCPRAPRDFQPQQQDQFQTTPASVLSASLRTSPETGWDRICRENASALAADMDRGNPGVAGRTDKVRRKPTQGTPG